MGYATFFELDCYMRQQFRQCSLAHHSNKNQSCLQQLCDIAGQELSFTVSFKQIIIIPNCQENHPVSRGDMELHPTNTETLIN